MSFPVEWKLVPLEDCMAAIIDYRGKSPRKVDFGIPLVTAKIVKAGQIMSPDEYIAEEDYGEWMRRGIPKAGDILLTTEAPLGEVAQLDDRKIALAQRLIALRGKVDVLDNCYLKFAMQGAFVQDQLRARATGTTVHGVRQSELRKVMLPVPPLAEQRAIADVLGTLDRKIELDQRMNETLEAMARAIFKSWFVDFDPVRAKAEGRPPFGMDADTAALFPDSFVDSPLGKIPAGWRVGRLDDLLLLQRGFDLPSQHRVTGEHPILSASGITGFHNEFRVKGPGVVTGRSGLIGKVFLVLQDFWPLNTTLWVKEFRVSSPTHTFHLLRELDFEIFNAGSAVPTLNRNHLHNLPVVVPIPRVIREFDALVYPMYKAISQNERQSSTLASLRNTLLPKLISGEIRVENTEQKAGRAV